MKILVCDPVSSKGVALFRRREDFQVEVLDRRLPEAELVGKVGDVDAMVVRSETKVTRKVIEAALRLKVVGRAGVGVDNVDVDAATQRGIVVMNTPSGNTISTAELSFSMLMALARKIPQAHASMKAGQWDKKSFKGTELHGKSLGVLGMGRIGTEVARRAMAFGMHVIAYDPYLSLSRAKALHVELAERLDEVFGRADFITVHMPLSEETKDMLDAEAFARMKPGVRVINCARGGIVNEEDLIAAIQQGKVAGAALDVYMKEPLAQDSPLRAVPEIIMTPHLGASTAEAQDNVGIEVAEAITDYLVTGTVHNAVNLPNLDAKAYETVKPFLILGGKLGRLVAQISSKRNDRLVITYGGRATELPTDPVTRAVLVGFLQSAGGQDVNQVNVRALANTLGLLVEEVKSNQETDYNEWLHIAAYSGEQRTSAGGTVLGKKHQPRIVRLMGQPVEIVPEGVLLLLNNKDRPGIVGHLGTLMAKHAVNIASMSLHRDSAGGQALTVLNLDTPPTAALLAEVQADPDIRNVRVARL
ncbi:MAG: phosphoglycerate dehydrogenase [Verrucomicrobia bacterium]|nr:phosphoglycerate dehydrogenase [Verrucomicrobiota bacterium]